LTWLAVGGLVAALLLALHRPGAAEARDPLADAVAVGPPDVVSVDLATGTTGPRPSCAPGDAKPTSPTRGVWYRVVPNEDLLTVATFPNGSGLWTLLALYDGSAQTELACSATLSLRAPVTAGQSYFLRVSGSRLSQPQASQRIGMILGPARPSNGLSAFDTVAPTTGALVAPAPNGAGWNRSDVTVTLTANDDPGGSRVREIERGASGAATAPSGVVAGSSAAVVVDQEGLTTVTYFARDNDGNAEAPRSLQVKLDKTAPGPTTATVAGGTPAAADRYTTSPTITLRSTDALSGVAAIYYRFVPHGAGAPTSGWLRYDGSFTAPPGDNDLYALAEDLAGNAETPSALGRFTMLYTVRLPIVGRPNSSSG
jgi:hypothetical protein